MLDFGNSDPLHQPVLLKLPALGINTMCLDGTSLVRYDITLWDTCALELDKLLAGLCLQSSLIKNSA